MEYRTHSDKYVAHFTSAFAGMALNFEIKFEGKSKRILADREIEKINKAKRGARADAIARSSTAGVRRSGRWFDRERLRADAKSR
jgi:hypothetical protein